MSSNLSNSLLSAVPKLNGTNYLDWKFAVSMVLRRAGCWEIASGTSAKPARGDTSDWERKSDEALTIIGLSVDPSQYEYIRDSETAHDAWKALQAKYEKASRASRINLKRQLYNFKHDPAKPVQVYIDGIKSLVRRLRAISVKIEDSDVMDVLIINLDESWGSIAAVLSQTIEDLSSVDDVTNALLDEEGRRGGAPSATDSDSDLAMLVCWRCGKSGHKQARCRKTQGTRVKEERANLAASDCEDEAHIVGTVW